MAYDPNSFNPNPFGLTAPGNVQYADPKTGQQMSAYVQGHGYATSVLEGPSTLPTATFNEAAYNQAQENKAAAAGGYKPADLSLPSTGQPVERTGTGQIALSNPGGASTSTIQARPADSLGRKLGPTEYANLVQQNNVSSANFSQYFNKDAQGNIYLKTTAPGAAPAPTPAPSQQQQLGLKIPGPSALSNYKESEIVRTPDGNVYLKPGVPQRWGIGADSVARGPALVPGEQESWVQEGMDILGLTRSESQARANAHFAGRPGFIPYGGTTAQGLSADPIKASYASVDFGTGAGNFTLPNGQTISALDLSTAAAAAGVSDPTAFVVGLTGILDKLVGTSALESERNSLTGSLAKDQTALTGMAGRQQALNSQFGVDADLAKITDLQNQITMKMAQYNAGMNQIEDQTTPLGLVQGQQAMLQRQQASDIGILTAQLAAAQGHLGLAQTLAQQALQVEFAPIEQRIQNTKDLLTINAQNMTAAQAKRAEDLNLLLGFRQEQIDQAKSEQAQNIGLMLDVAKAGGDPSVVNLKGSVASNIKAASPYLTASGDFSRNDQIVQNLSDKFINEDIVRDYNVVDEAYDSAMTVPATNNAVGVDSVTLITAYARALNPASVRLGESTQQLIQDNAQSIAARLGQTVDQLINNTANLTPEAIKLIQDSIANQYSVYTNKYNAVRNQYGSQIDTRTGGNDGVRFLIDYSANQAGQKTFQSPNTTITQGSGTADFDDTARATGLLSGTTPTNRQLADASGWTPGKSSLSVSPSSTVTPLHIAVAIGKYESGMKYAAVGNATSSGDRAYGAYQIMGANIPSWTKAATGKSYTVAQFLNNPALQDVTANYKIAEYYKKYGNADDVATAWFAGPGAVGKNSKAKDVNGTSVPSYVQAVRSLLSGVLKQGFNPSGKSVPKNYA